MMEIQKVIGLIRELTKKTVGNGCTEAEAFSAARKVGELLKVYNLSMDKVFLGESKCVTDSIPTGRQRRHPIDYCVVAIAEFCDCRIWFSHSPFPGQYREYKVFGLETDVEMCKYLYNMVYNAIEGETARFKQTDVYTKGVRRKQLSVSFQKGMSVRISNRLQNMMILRHKEETQEGVAFAEATGTSLVVVKRNKVEDEFEALNLGLRKAARAAFSVNDTAYGHGQQAGERVNLNRPMGGEAVGLLS
jgi:hypothetical protein